MVELCVMAACVAVCAALLLPVLHAAQEEAKIVSCADNLKRIGLAEITYQDQNNGYFTPTAMPNYRPTWTFKEKTFQSKGVAKWPFYLLSTGMVDASSKTGGMLPAEFHCPIRRQSRFSSFEYDGFAHLDYGMNYAFSPVESNGLYQHVVQVEKPAAQIIFGDAKQLSWPDDTGNYAIPCRVNVKGTWGKPETLTKMDENVFLGHGGGHFAYVDGHVAFIEVKAGNTEEGRMAFWKETYCGELNAWCVRKFK